MDEDDRQTDGNDQGAQDGLSEDELSWMNGGTASTEPSEPEPFSPGSYSTIS